MGTGDVAVVEAEVIPRLYLYAGIVAAFIAVLAFASCEHHNAKVARTERAEALGQLADARSANESNQIVIDAQNKALDKWAEVGVSPQQVAEFIAAETEARKKAETTARLMKLAKESDRALPECVALLRASLSRTCPNIAAGLQKLAGSEDRTR